MVLKNNEKLIKILQAVSVLFMLGMVATMLILMNKFDINIENAAYLSSYIKGGTLTVALILIGFSIVKSFALIFPPAVLCSQIGMEGKGVIGSLDEAGGGPTN